MKYKKVELKGLPEYELGTVVWAWNDNPSYKVIGIYGGYNGLGEKREHLIFFLGDDGYTWYRNIRPVPAWTPEKGELVACWDSVHVHVFFCVYRSDGRTYYENDLSVTYLWDFIARIPDGKRTYTEEELTPQWFKANSEVMEA